MDKDLQIDEDYKKSFNDGYTLAKELGMSKESLQGISAGSDRMKAIGHGMDQFKKEIEMSKEKAKIRENMKLREHGKDDPKPPEKTKGKGMDMDI
ncbi:hypothetical protein [Ekhidna sp.]|jgi:hypothetical protein|uniref:hypothetical protein n=1 Tax=Ekhidna sp. TaxID=2608089 RepID=UPI0032EF578D